MVCSGLWEPVVLLLAGEDETARSAGNGIGKEKLLKIEP
jgi:hypothetical protein